MRASYALNRARTSACLWIAFSPIHERPEWAALPWVVIRKRMVPLHPPSTVPLVGSSSTAKSASSSSGPLRITRPRPLASLETSSWS